MRKKKLLFILLICNVGVLLPLLIFMGENYSIDSYGIVNSGPFGHMIAFIGSYRFFGAFVYWLYTLSGHNPIICADIDIVLFVIITSLSISFLSYFIISKIKTNSKMIVCVIDIAVLISIVNVWFCDILSFPECIFITAVGIWTCFAAIMVYIKSQKLVSCIITGILLVLATAVYQQFIIVFAIYIIAICSVDVIKGEIQGVKKVLLHYLKPAVVIAVSGLVYLLIAKGVANAFAIQSNSRIYFSISLILEEIVYFLGNQHSFIKGRGYFSSEILTILFLMISIIWIISLIVDFKREDRKKAVALAGTSIIAYASVYSIGIVSSSHETRTILAFFTMYFLFSLEIILLNKNEVVKTLIAILLIVVLFVNVFGIIKAEIKLKKTNVYDKLYFEYIVKVIDDYDIDKNEEITEIKICFDDKKEMLGDAIAADYAATSYLQLLSGKIYNVSYLGDDEKNRIFSQTNWTELSEEQFVFDDDTLYICVY